MEIPSFVQPHDKADLLPVRMCNELVYCERLFHLEHVQGVFVDSADTVEGRDQHERAARWAKNRSRRAPSEPSWPGLPRSLELTSEAWGLRGQMDFVEIEDDRVVVVEAKHGRAPKSSEHHWREYELHYEAWPADVAQVGLYMAMLRELGMPADEARIYYRSSRSTTTIAWSDQLEAFLHAVVRRAREVNQHGTPPLPLKDSPKCPGCSLHGVCLPDEHHALVEQAPALRRLPIATDERSFVHVASPGATVRKDGEALRIVDRNGEETRVLTKDVAHLSVFGPVQVTTPALHHLLRHGVAVSHHSSGGALLGVSAALGTRNVGMRRAQYRAADEAERCVTIARGLVVAKIRNQRTVLRRQLRQRDDLGEHERLEIEDTLEKMHVSQRWAERSTTLDVLRGHEGEAAARYFGVLGHLLPRPWKEHFDGRSRRPPRDRVNALLSFAYTLLTREAIAAAARVGLDPMLGFFHSMIPGRPALALDLIEPFRPAWADTAVLRLVATSGVDLDEFAETAAGVFLSDSGRSKLIAAHERRAREETTHPRFGYRMAYRRMLELELRVLGKYLLDEIADYTPIWTR
jgi:CRISPR-associated protein Cas1